MSSSIFPRARDRLKSYRLLLSNASMEAGSRNFLRKRVGGISQFSSSETKNFRALPVRKGYTRPLNDAVGDRALGFLKQAPAPVVAGEVLVIQVDGGGVPMISAREHARQVASSLTR